MLVGRRGGSVHLSYCIENLILHRDRISIDMCWWGGGNARTHTHTHTHKHATHTTHTHIHIAHNTWPSTSESTWYKSALFSRICFTVVLAAAATVMIVSPGCDVFFVKTNKQIFSKKDHFLFQTGVLFFGGFSFWAFSAIVECASHGVLF